MPPQRRVTLPTPVCAPRNSVNQESHPVVDAVLKDLKICTRRLQAALSSHRTELQVLEKLHYKGNNQHRTALFWRRVADIKRSARRIEELELFDVVEKVRLSFWGDPSLHKFVHHSADDPLLVYGRRDAGQKF